MSTKNRWPSWSSKSRRPASEPYHQVVGLGGLLPIDVNEDNDEKQTVLVSPAKTSSRPGRRRPPNLTIIPPDYDNTNFSYLSPASASHNGPLVQSASSLLALVNDTLQVWSPTVIRPKLSLSIHKPLPSRPRSISLPSTPDLPVELPGSLLLDNQGFPSPPPVAGPFSATFGTMRPLRSGSTLDSTVRPVPHTAKVPQHKKSLSEASLKGHAKSRNSLLASPSTESRLTACSESTNGGQSGSSDSIRASIGLEALQPSPLIVAGRPRKKHGGEPKGCRQDHLGPPSPSPASSSLTRSKRIDELKATITAQDQTISTLQAQFASLRTSHEAHIASLVNAHAAEVASLKNYTRSLEQQQQRSLHHASSNHLLFVLDTTEPQSPDKVSPRTASSSASATSTRSFKLLTPDSPSRPSFRRGPLTPEMETLKRKLTTTRRPEIDTENLVRERDKYRNNCKAFEDQIERLTGKLNQVKDERDDYAKVVHNLEFAREEMEKKASKIVRLEKSTLALQNTIDHLEHRLELANIQKLDAEEETHNLRTQQSPFGASPTATTRSQGQDLAVQPTTRRSARASVYTIFTDDSPLNQFQEMVPANLIPFIDRIERLQEQLHQEELSNAEMRASGALSPQTYDKRDVLFKEIDARNLRLKSTINDLRNGWKGFEQQLREKDARNAESQTQLDKVEENNALLKEKLQLKVNVLEQFERELHYHKLLLKIEIKRNAALTIFSDVEDPHEDMSSLASKHDIDKWVDQLQARLKKAKAKKESVAPADESLETKNEDLRKTIEYYIREIIYYKIDIRGYKSDIKQLKKDVTDMVSNMQTMQLNLSSQPNESESGTPQPLHNRPSTPVFGNAYRTGGRDISVSPSSASTGGAVSFRQLSDNSNIGGQSCGKPKHVTKRIPAPLELGETMMPHTPSPSPKTAINRANEADKLDPGSSPRSIARLSPERRKPTPPSPDQELFGDMATNFPLSTPAVPRRIEYRTGEVPIIDIPPRKMMKTQQSPSKTDAPELKTTPGRPPRPSVGLFDTPLAAPHADGSERPSPPRKDVMAEAIHNTTELVQLQKQLTERRPSNTSSSSGTPRQFPYTGKEDIRTSTSTTGSSYPIGLPFRSREGSNAASASTRPPSSSERRPSTSCSTNTPFVIGMGSPHNPAFMSPVLAPISTVQPAVCSITRGCVMSSSLRTGGVGGTMASTTPVGSPTDARPSFFGSGAGKKNFVTPPPSRNGSVASGSNSRSNSAAGQNHVAFTPNTNATFSFRSGNTGSAVSFAAPTAASAGRSRNGTPSHSRNVSGSSIRHAINLPGRLDFIKGKGKQRKASVSSISNPTLLNSPFDIHVSTNTAKQQHKDSGKIVEPAGFAIGEAI